jgi:acetyl-CoA decarbonylase/synthase complex subunit delta
MDISKILKEYEVLELQGLEIEGDIELVLSPAVMSYVATQVSAAQTLAQVELEKATFEYKKAEWKGQIEEVVLGATKANGGTRGKTLTIGGEKALPYYNFDEVMKNPPIVSIDTFDTPPPFTKAVRERYEDVVNNPAEWAKKNVDKYGADLVAVHLVSTDPFTKNTPAKEAAKTVEEVLQAVKVPLIIGGSGNPDKDPEVLEKACEVAAGERCLIASANLNMDYERIAKAAKKYGHVVLSFTAMDLNQQKTLNRYLFKAGTERNSLVMDPTTAALGMGLDYAFTVFERVRIDGLKGDKDLSFPIMSAPSNSWGSREAWLKASMLKEDTDWGPREIRGPMWEVTTALTLSLAGGDIFMMSHPTSVRFFKEMIKTLAGRGEEKAVDIQNWIKGVK